MTKITLLCHPAKYSNFISVPHFDTLWSNYFTREFLDFNKKYDPASCIITVNHLQKDETWYKLYLDQGFRLIIDNLWDNHTQTISTINGSILTLRAPNWAWFNSALNYIDLKYDELTLKSCPTKFFLMLMRLKRLHRDQLLKRTEAYLSDSLYSYTSQGITMNNDMIINGDVEQHYINPHWYESTVFSLVAESNLTSPTFMSEKTFKPIAFEHPFIVWGSPNTLKYLHTMGFETFGHVIDETYDSIDDNNKRLNSIIKIIDNLFIDFKNKNLQFADTLTQQKLKHNREHFYNQELLLKMFIQEVVNPILEFVEK